MLLGIENWETERLSDLKKSYVKVSCLELLGIVLEHKKPNLCFRGVLQLLFSTLKYTTLLN